MAGEGDPPSRSRRASRAVRRDEGEVSQWPRGLVDYVPSGAPDAGVPPEEEERTAQRLRLAGRLIDLLRAQGEDDPSWMVRLQEAEHAYRAGDRARASRAVDALLGELGERADRARHRETAQRQP